MSTTAVAAVMLAAMLCGAETDASAQLSSVGNLSVSCKTSGNAAPTLGARGGVRADALYERDRLNFIALRNPGAEARPVSLGFEGRAHGLFSGLEIEGGREISVPAGFCDLFTVEPE